MGPPWERDVLSGAALCLWSDPWKGWEQKAFLPWFLAFPKHWLRVRLCFIAFIGFLCGSDGKESACNARNLGSIPRSGRSLEKGMATHCSILAWRIPWTEEPGRLPSMGLQRIGHDWVTNTFTFTYVLEHALCRFVLLCFALSSQFESKLPEGTELVNFVTEFSPFLSVGILYIFIEWINLQLTLLITFISFNVFSYTFYTW